MVLGHSLIESPNTTVQSTNQVVHSIEETEHKMSGPAANESPTGIIQRNRWNRFHPICVGIDVVKDKCGGKRVGKETGKKDESIQNERYKYEVKANSLHSYYFIYISFPRNRNTYDESSTSLR